MSKQKVNHYNRRNYRLTLVSVLLILLGFVLMQGGGSEDPTQFSHEIFSFRRITLSPILLLSGYLLMIFAIMLKPKPKS